MALPSVPDTHAGLQMVKLFVMLIDDFCSCQ